MKQYDTTVTQRGQVTLPAEVRRILGVAPRDKVTFQVESDDVRILSPRHTLESVYNSVRPRKEYEGRDIDDLIKLANEENARAVVGKMKRD